MLWQDGLTKFQDLGAMACGGAVPRVIKEPRWPAGVAQQLSVSGVGNAGRLNIAMSLWLQAFGQATCGQEGRTGIFEIRFLSK